MFKTLLLLILAFVMMLAPEPGLAKRAAPSASITLTELVDGVPLFRRTYRRGRPNYKSYRGNSRHRAKKLGPLRRWKLRRKAQRKHGTPSVRVGAPVRTMPKK